MRQEKIKSERVVMKLNVEGKKGRRKPKQR
jgi:hypothetical protein